jgi:hypothetical protein
MKFDVENPVHRLYYKTFEDTGSWKHCPYQWIIEDDALSVPHYCQQKLNEWYWNNDRAVQKLIAGQQVQRQPKRASKPMALRAVG